MGTNKEILNSLGKMYAGGGSMTENIDKAGGKGTDKKNDSEYLTGEMVSYSLTFL